MERDLVFDIGAHNGDDTAYYVRRGFRVVGIDADPAMIAACEQCFREEIRAGRLVLLNVGLAAEEGNGGVWSSLDPALASRGGLATHPVTVPARPLRGLTHAYAWVSYVRETTNSIWYDLHAAR